MLKNGWKVLALLLLTSCTPRVTLQTTSPVGQVQRVTQQAEFPSLVMDACTMLVRVPITNGTKVDTLYGMALLTCPDWPEPEAAFRRAHATAPLAYPIEARHP